MAKKSKEGEVDQIDKSFDGNNGFCATGAESQSIAALARYGPHALSFCRARPYALIGTPVRV